MTSSRGTAWPWLSALVLIACSCSRGTTQVAPAPVASTLDTRSPETLPADPGAFSRWRDGSTRFVVYVPTPQAVVDKMLEVANVHRGDVVYDLGCGDGRIVVTAAKRYGARAVGFDIDPERVAEAQENVRRAGIQDLATIRQADVFTLDLTPATVVTIYLLPRLNLRLVPQLERLAPGTRIVSHDFDIEGTVLGGMWRMEAPYFGRANERFEAGVPEDDAHYAQVEHRVYWWTTPLRWEGGRDE